MELALGLVVALAVGSLFGFALATLLPHTGDAAQVAVLICGFMSALAWALSVAGALFLTRRWRIINHVLWGGWLNLIAAAFAALTAGYAATLKIF